jgi:hypothetical protein
MSEKSRSGSGTNIPDHISESLETIFGLKILKFFDSDPDDLKSGVFLILVLGSGMEKFGSGMENTAYLLKNTNNLPPSPPTA